MNNEETSCYLLRYDNKLTSCSSSNVPVLSHPLQSAKIYTGENSKDQCDNGTNGNDSSFMDPLVLGAILNQDDTPLAATAERDVKDEAPGHERRAPVLDNTLTMNLEDRIVIDIVLPDFIAWKTMRQRIADKFSTTAKLDISSSFLRDFTIDEKDSSKRRLKILDDLSGLKTYSQLTQSDYDSNVRELREVLLVAWQRNKRVETVRLVTELSKTLATISNAAFYPHQWVLLTEVIELFGVLVYERLLTKANEERKLLHQPPLSPSFTSNDIPPNTTEIAKNWFCKISDIKEIVPRFYVECSMIRCMRFLDSGSLRVNMLRLSSIASKLGDPLITAYGRMFACKMSIYIEAADRAPHWKALNDWMQSNERFARVELVWPALQWVMQCVSFGAMSYEDLAPLWAYAAQPEQRPTVLSAFINSVSLKYLTHHVMKFVELVTDKENNTTEMKALASRLLLADIPENHQTSVLRIMWRSIENTLEMKDFLECCVIWSSYTSRYFTTLEVLAVCELLVTRLKKAKNHSGLPSIFPADIPPVLLAILRGLVDGTNVDPVKLMDDDNFCTLIDLLRDDLSVTSDCAQCLLAAVVSSKLQHSINNFLVAYKIVEQCGRLCMCLKADSSKEEINRICALVCDSLDRMCLTNDPERFLAWLVAARATLGQWQIILQHLCSILLRASIMFTETLPDSTKKANFMRACIANEFIMLPSVEDPTTKCRMALQCVQLALMVNSLPQTDALIYIIIEELSAVPLSQLVPIVSAFLAILVYVPDAPHKSHLHMFKKFCKFLTNRAINDATMLSGIWLDGLRYLWAVARPEYPSHFGCVQANDQLYGQSQAFQETVQTLFAYGMTEILSLLEKDTTERLPLELLEFSVTRIQLDETGSRLVWKLLKRCVRYKVSQRKLDFVLSTLKELEKENELVAEMIKRLPN